MGNGGDFDHFPIFLEVARGSQKPPSPFKFNFEWLKEAIFINLVKENWRPFDQEANESASMQFHRNLKVVKKFIVEWDANK